jgi:hypothetical protein
LAGQQTRGSLSLKSQQDDGDAKPGPVGANLEAGPMPVKDIQMSAADRAMFDLAKQIRAISPDITGDAKIKAIAALTEHMAKSWSGPDSLHFDTNVIALSMIIRLREDKVFGNCYDMNLARADHYFQTRAWVSLFGNNMVPVQFALTLGYEGVKWVLVGLLGRPAYMVTGACEASLPGAQSFEWGIRGIVVGADDWKEDTKNDPAKVQKRVDLFWQQFRNAKQ